MVVRIQAVNQRLLSDVHSLGILWQLGGLMMQFFMFSDFPKSPQGKGLEEFERMSHFIRWFGFEIAAFVSGLFMWIIKKLVTQPIIEKFAFNKSRKADA